MMLATMRTPVKVKTKASLWTLTVALCTLVIIVYYYTVTQTQPAGCYSETTKRPSWPPMPGNATTSDWTTTPRTTTSRPSPPTRRQLLLVTYGRTGSSFTSAIISQDPSVFYIFEPLYGLHTQLIAENITESTLEKVFNIIDAFLECDFRALDASLFADVLFASSQSTLPLYNCLKNKALSGHSHVACFLSTWNSCQKSNMTFIKFIRFRTEWAEQFLKRYQNLKILYLVRDFRAVLFSQERNLRPKKRPSAERAGDFCLQAMKDFQIFHRLNYMFQGRVKGIRYEHGCLDTIDYARNIYTFAGLNFNNNTKQFLHNITKSNRTDRDVVDPFSVVRNDAIQTMNYWRQTADFKTVKTIDRNCKGVYSLFGYRPVQSQQELASNVSLVNTVNNSLFNTF